MLRVVKDVMKRALDCGVLGPIDSVYESVADRGIHLRVARITNLERKKAASKGRSGNPFLDPEPELVVPLNAGPHHRVLLNKFPVFEHHMLIVTTAFEPQTDPLTLADFAAIQTLKEHSKDGEEWLVFYNHGPLRFGLGLVEVLGNVS